MPEGSTQKHFNHIQHNISLDEIKSEKSSDSKDQKDKKSKKQCMNNILVKTNNLEIKPNSNLSMIFKQLKDHRFKSKLKSPLTMTRKKYTHEFENNYEELMTLDPNFKEKYSLENDNMIVVCKFLPIKINKTQDGEFQAKIIKDSNQFYLSRHLLNGNYKKVVCVGL